VKKIWDVCSSAFRLPGGWGNELEWRRARTLHVAHLFIFFGGFLYLILPPSILNGQDSFVVGTILYSLIGTLLLRFRKLTLSAFWSISIIWLIFAVGSFTEGGLDSSSFGGTISIVVFAGLVYGLRGAIVTAVANMITGAVWVYLSTKGLMPPPALAYSDLNIFADYSVYVMMSAIFTGVAVNSIDRSTARFERELRDRKKAEERYRNLVERIPDGVYRSTIDGRLLDVNPAMVRILRYGSVDELLAVDIARDLYFTPEERQHALQLLTKDEMAVFRLRRKDGMEIWVEGHGRMIPAINGDPAQFEGILRDVTERIRTEQALRQAQKVESLGILAGGVAHDFNNILQAILGQASLAGGKLDESNPARAHVMKIERAATRAAELTQHLLAYSGRSKFELRTFSLNELIKDNLHLLEVTIPKIVRLNAELDHRHSSIQADPGQIQQIVMNLIINAGEAIGDKPGMVTIRTRTEHISDSIKQWMAIVGERMAAGDYVVLEIEDTGIGMSPGTLARIFDPFFTTKFTGRGLGLAAVLGIIRGHRGGLIVESAEGKGTTFRLAFPAVPEDDTQRESSAPSNGTMEGTVLVIDDEQFVREFVTDVLGEKRIPCLTAEDGYVGIELFRKRCKEISVVLLDLSMPGMGGEETFRRLKEIDPTVKVVMSSGYSESEISAQFAGRGLAGFVQKPYTLEALVAALNQHAKKSPPL